MSKAVRRRRSGGNADRGGKSSGRTTAALAMAVSAAVAAQMTSSANAAQYVYSPAGGTTQWSAGTNWSAVPVSAATTQLTFVGNNATVIPDGQLTTTTNDILGNFLLNILDLQGTGPATTDAGVTISGNPLQFVIDGATLPVINLNALDGAA